MMVVGMREFLLRTRIDAGLVEAWVAAGWLLPEEADGERRFTERDMARALLIRELRDELGVNDEGVAVILDLLDQLHGVRAALRRVSLAMREREVGGN